MHAGARSSVLMSDKKVQAHQSSINELKLGNEEFQNVGHLVTNPQCNGQRQVEKCFSVQKF